MREFVKEIEQLAGRPPIIYSGGFWKSRLNHMTDSLGCLLWLPQYGPAPESPRAWKKWTFWQYSDETINAARLRPVPGVGQGCDRNLLDGTFAELRNLTLDGVENPEKSTMKPKPGTKQR